MGILERAHLASITSLARSLRWLQATHFSRSQENILGFSAALRGYLESAADAYDLMSHLPGNLFNAMPYIYLALSGSESVKKTMISMGDLEERLIHFTYARRPKKGDVPLPGHQNKSNAAYISAIEKIGVTGATSLYGELCELTHPASASVFCFLEEEESSLTFTPTRDGALIDGIIDRYEQTILNLTQFSINPALISLSFLNRLVNEWPSLSDKAIAGIGNMTAMLAEIDEFLCRPRSEEEDRELLKQCLAKLRPSKS
jgi:hypothetical protein